MVDTVKIVEQFKDFEDEELWNKMNRMVTQSYSDNWTWRQIGKLLKVKHKPILKWRGICKAYKNPISKSNVG
jgi:hypothetical protein